MGYDRLPGAILSGQWIKLGVHGADADPDGTPELVEATGAVFAPHARPFRLRPGGPVIVQKLRIVQLYHSAVADH